MMWDFSTVVIRLESNAKAVMLALTEAMCGNW